MGFWHTGYMEFHEQTGSSTDCKLFNDPRPPEFPCERCGEIFSSIDVLNRHRFNDHTSSRARLFLRGRECGRTRISIVSEVEPSDWLFHNTLGITVNDKEVDEPTAKDLLCLSRGVVRLGLRGEALDQVYEISIEIAEENDLLNVEASLNELILGRRLSRAAIIEFHERCRPLKTSAAFSNGLSNYFFGVLARERPTESSTLRSKSKMRTYRECFDDSVAQLSQIDRPAAESVCGLVGFHYNHFDHAIQKLRSPKMFRVVNRLSDLLRGDGAREMRSLRGEKPEANLDHLLCDKVTDKILDWCAIPLDGSAAIEISEMEKALPNIEPLDQLKIRLIATEHHLSVGDVRAAVLHADELRNNTSTTAWQEAVRSRVREIQWTKQ
jgi:hypothetical protein